MIETIQRIETDRKWAVVQYDSKRLCYCIGIGYKGEVKPFDYQEWSKAYVDRQQAVCIAERRIKD